MSFHPGGETSKDTQSIWPLNTAQDQPGKKLASLEDKSPCMEGGHPESHTAAGYMREATCLKHSGSYYSGWVVTIIQQGDHITMVAV